MIAARFAEVWSLSHRTNVTPLQSVPDGDDILFLLDVKLSQSEHTDCRKSVITPTGIKQHLTAKQHHNHCVCVPTCSKSDCIFTSIGYCVVERISGFDTHGSAQTSLHYCISFIDTSSSYSSLQQEQSRCDGYG